MTAPTSKTQGYIVVWDDTPLVVLRDGVLYNAGYRKTVTLFPTRRAANAAVKRTARNFGDRTADYRIYRVTRGDRSAVVADGGAA